MRTQRDEDVFDMWPGAFECRGTAARSAEAVNAIVDKKPQPEPSAQEVLAGLVERVT